MLLMNPQDHSTKLDHKASGPLPKNSGIAQFHIICSGRAQCDDVLGWVIRTPGFTPLTVTTPPTLDGYAIQYQALPNTTQLAKWGFSGWWILSDKGYMHALGLTSHSGPWHCKGLGIPGAKTSQGAGTVSVVRAPGAECRFTAACRAVVAPEWLPHSCLGDVASDGSFLVMITYLR